MSIDSNEDMKAVEVVKTLAEFVKKDQSKSNAAMLMSLSKKAMELKAKYPNNEKVTSGCDMFTIFVSRRLSKVDTREDYSKTKELLLKNIDQFVQRIDHSVDQIVKHSIPFIADGSTILVHGHSTVVLAILKKASELGMSLRVIVTESQPDSAGLLMARELDKASIPTTVIADSAVAAVMDTVDVVFCGSESIAENGGIINKIGTYQISIVAKAYSKPFYVAAESIKFVRIFPLRQNEIPRKECPYEICEHCKGVSAKTFDEEGQGFVNFVNPLRDYTPPEYISLLFTDIGVITPSAVGEEILKLYQN